MIKDTKIVAYGEFQRMIKMLVNTPMHVREPNSQTLICAENTQQYKDTYSNLLSIIGLEGCLLFEMMDITSDKNDSTVITFSVLPMGESLLTNVVFVEELEIATIINSFKADINTEEKTITVTLPNDIPVVEALNVLYAISLHYVEKPENITADEREVLERLIEVAENVQLNFKKLRVEKHSWVDYNTVIEENKTFVKKLIEVK